MEASKKIWLHPQDIYSVGCLNWKLDLGGKRTN